MKIKKIKSPVKKTICLEIKDFSKGLNTVINENLLEPDYGVNCYNFSYHNGALESGLGLEELEIDYSKNNSEKNVLGLPADVDFKKVWQFKHWDNNNQKSLRNNSCPFHTQCYCGICLQHRIMIVSYKAIDCLVRSYL